jgi:hypothetical protein
MAILASLIVEDLTATISLPNPFTATSLHVNWGDGTVEDLPTLAGATNQPQTFTHTYDAAGDYAFTASATGYTTASILDLPIVGTLTVTPSEVDAVEAPLTAYNLSAARPFVDTDTLIWDDADGGSVWNANQWNATEWSVACEWLPDDESFPTVVPCVPFSLDDGTINVTIAEFDDPARNEYPGTLTFTVEQVAVEQDVSLPGVATVIVRGAGTASVVEFEEPPPPNYPPDWPVGPGEMHFRLWEQDIGQLDLSCENGFVVREYDIAYPEIREVSYDNSLNDGTADLTQFFGSRAVSLDLTLRPTEFVSGQGAQWSESRMRDAVMRFLAPNRRPWLYYSEHGDLRCRRILLRPASAGMAVSLPRFNQVAVGWIAPNPHIEGFFNKCTTVDLDFTESTIDVDVENEGNIGADWTITIEGEMAKPEFSVDGNSTMNLQLDYNAVRGDTVVIRSHDRTVLVNGKPIGYKYVNDKSRWFRIPPGPHQFNVIHHGVIKEVGQFPDGAWAPDPTSPPDALPEATWATDGPYDAGHPPYPPTGWALKDLTDATEITVCYRDTWI